MNNFIMELKKKRAKAIRGEYGSVLDGCPDSYLAPFCVLGGGADHVRVIERLLLSRAEKILRVLVVGVYGGRDFWGLKALGHDVVGFNLTPDVGCSPTFIGNAEDVWPFPDESFDLVVMGEILEHLVKDQLALNEARRVLTPSGRVIVTVPFLHDEPEYHIRVHTPKSIQRLLTNTGFSINCYLERPGLPGLAYLSRLLNFYMICIISILGKSHYRPITKLIGDVEFKFGSKFKLIRSIAGKFRFSNWGSIILVTKSDDNSSYISLNIDAFKNK